MMADLQLPIVRIASSFVGVATQLAALLFGKRLDWPPLESRERKLAFGLTMGLAAVTIAILWAFSIDSNHSTTLFVIALALLLLSVLSFFGLLRVLGQVSFGWEEVTEAGETRESKIIGGFTLTPRAQELSQTKTIPQIFHGAGYKPHLVWTSESRSAATIAVTALFITMVATGSIGLAAMGFGVSSKLASEERQEPNSVAVVESAAVQAKRSLKAFLIEVGKRTAPYSRDQLRLRGCVIQAVVRARGSSEGRRLSVGGRLYLSSKEPVVQLSDPTVRVVDFVFVPLDGTHSTPATIWIQLPNGSPGPFYVQVAVRRPQAKALDLRSTDIFSSACTLV